MKATLAAYSRALTSFWHAQPPPVPQAQVDHGARLAAADRMEKAAANFMRRGDEPTRDALLDACFDYRRARADEGRQGR